jgi:outer membrane protein assembly factor BamB
VHAYPAIFHQSEPMGGDGPRATPTIADGDVYSLGAVGDLICLDGATGTPRWAVNILADNGARNVAWGMAGSPLVLGSVVVVNPGIDPDHNAGHAVAAYDRKTGKRVWVAGDNAAGYSSPQRARLAGADQILVFDGGGLAGLDPADGREFWRYPWITFSSMNIIQPLVLPGDRALISSEVSNGCALIEVRRSEGGWTAAPVWQNHYLGAKFSNPVTHGGHVYGLSNGILVCLDGATGARRWKEGRFGHGQILLAGDVLLIVSESGELAAVAADPSGYRELGRLKVFSGKTWNTPALAGGQLFLRNHKEMVCLELPNPEAPGRK